MAEAIGTAGSGHPNLNLTAEERRTYGSLLKEADPDGFGAVSGDVAVKFFERTKLPADVLGEIWQIADTENRGFLTPAGFGIVLRLIGHAQAGRSPSAQIATTPAPIPRFEGAQPPPGPPPAAQPVATPTSPSQTIPPPIRVPPLSPEKVGEYSNLFEKSGAENGMLSGTVAKQIFERARLPNEVLGRIWALSDTQGRGSLDVTEFTIAMHLLASYKGGAMRGVPSTLPPGLYEAAARRPHTRMGSGSRPGSSSFNGPFQAQQTGFGNVRPQSPITRAQVGTPISTQSTGEVWAISPADKARFDSIFATVDRQGRGFITGEQAVEFFGNARLPEEILERIWDLADINSEGQLNRDEFAVAMYLIRQQRGTKDGRGNLPPTLPPALIPPSMRRQYVPPSQPTAPAFENAPVTKPRSAADDLFGLDAFGPLTTTQRQIPQSTGGTDAGPFANPPAQSSPVVSSPGTSFKPFVPSSSFGQSISTIPQSTGSPAPGQHRGISAATTGADDLLGDADPEVSSKLTNETTELANVSNQVANLSKQMTEVQSTRSLTEQELSQNTMQKRAFEQRLAQLRTLYENEVKEVKTLQEQLTASKNDTKRLQQDMAVIDGSHQDLSTQHQQIRAALESDQRENASLKEKIRQLNVEVEQLKPQLEKLKSDARQLKGLVAINKKQLGTNEGERDRLKAEIAAAHKQVEDATREAEESSRQLEASKVELEEARNIPVPSLKSAPVMASPAPSTSSNPFFRRTTGPSEAPFSPPAPNHDTPTEKGNAFDNIFGPSFGSAAAVPAPSTSFRSESPAHATSGSTAPTSVESPASSVAHEAIEPPAPAQSNQITSAALPFRTPLSRGDSISSSVRVAPPASRLSPADTPRAVTPSTSTASPGDRRTMSEDPFTTAAAPDEEQESVKRSLPTATSPEPSHREVIKKASAEEIGGIPGAFPDVETPRSGTPVQSTSVAHSAAPVIAIGAGVATLAAGAGLAAAVTTNGDEKDKGKAPEQPAESASKEEKSNFDEFFGGPAHQRTPSEQAADFDSAFASMKQAPAANGTATAASQEFPAIRELDDNDDDSSDDGQETPLKFDDDFNSKSPKKATEESSTAAEKQVDMASAIPSSLQPPRPILQSMSSAGSSLPGIDQQTSPPLYADAVPNDNPTHFPREYKGLLPEREDPTVPVQINGGSANAVSAPRGGPPAYGPEVGHARSMSDSNPPAPPPKASPFDFDSAFAGVGPAQVEDDSDDEHDMYKPSKAQAPEFDPTFDTPIQSRSNTAASSAAPPMLYNSVTNRSSESPKDDFQGVSTLPSSGNAFAFAINPSSLPANTVSGIPANSHDWDDIFSGLGSNTQSATTPGFGDVAPAATTAAATAPGEEATKRITEPVTNPTSLAPPSKSSAPERPQPGRALSTGTEHDDPILKRLTAMGWGRDESLAALEKYDYNIDKAADYLTFRS